MEPTGQGIRQQLVLRVRLHYVAAFRGLIGPHLAEATPACKEAGVAPPFVPSKAVAEDHISQLRAAGERVPGEMTGNLECGPLPTLQAAHPSCRKRPFASCDQKGGCGWVPEEGQCHPGGSHNPPCPGALSSWEKAWRKAPPPAPALEEWPSEAVGSGPPHCHGAQRAASRGSGAWVVALPPSSLVQTTHPYKDR